MEMNSTTALGQAMQTKASTSQQSLQKRPSTKLFIQMSGAPGSGKSATANLLGPRIDAWVVPHDLIKSTILDRDMDFDQAGKLTYSLDWALAEDAMTHGRSVIIDSVCNYKQTIDRGRSLAHKYGFAYWYIEVRINIASLAVLNDRLANRVSLKAQRTSIDQYPSGMKKSDPERMQEEARARFEKWILQPCRPERNVIIVDAEGALDERVEYILERLSGEDSP